MIAAAFACAIIAASAEAADSLAVVDPLPPGPYAVGCSNVEQDFSRLMPGETAQNYWEGVPDGSRQRYVTQLLVDPADSLSVNVNVPDDRELFVNHASQTAAEGARGLLSDVIRQSAVRLSAADGQCGAAHATRRGRADLERSRPCTGRCWCSRTDWAAARFPATTSLR